MDLKRKTSIEWSYLVGVEILEPTGWDRKDLDYSFFLEPIVLEEFFIRLNRSIWIPRMDALN